MYTNQQVHFEAGIADCAISFLFAMFIKHRTYPYSGYINVINHIITVSKQDILRKKYPYDRFVVTTSRVF